MGKARCDQDFADVHERSSEIAWWRCPCFILPRLAIIVGASAVLAFCGDGESHELYSALKVPGSDASCCNDRDCREVPWRERGGALEFLLDGVWVRPGPRNMLPPLDDRAHACWPRDGNPPEPRCLIPPSLGA